MVCGDESDSVIVSGGARYPCARLRRSRPMQYRSEALESRVWSIWNEFRQGQVG